MGKHEGPAFGKNWSENLRQVTEKEKKNGEEKRQEFAAMLATLRVTITFTKDSLEHSRR